MCIFHKDDFPEKKCKKTLDISLGLVYNKYRKLRKEVNQMLVVLIILMVVGVVIFGGSMPLIIITEKPIFGITMVMGGVLTVVSMIMTVVSVL